MKTIQVKLENGKNITLEVEFYGFRSLGSFFRLEKDPKNGYVLSTDKANIEVINYFSAPKNFTGKKVALRISNEVNELLKKTQDEYKKEISEKNEQERKNLIAKCPQKKVLLFSGWYLSDPAQIVTLYEDGNIWYVAESHATVSKIKQSDVVDYEDISLNTNFESRCYILSEDQIAELIELNKSRKQEIVAVENKKENEEKETLTKLIEKAKTEGQRQVVKTWTEPCDGSVEDCSFDSLTQFVTPEGKFEYNRSHCY